MMAYEGSETSRDNFVKFIYQFQPETKTLIWKLERILNKLYRQNLSLLFNETHTHTHTHTYIYIYIYIYVCILYEENEKKNAFKPMKKMYKLIPH